MKYPHLFKGNLVRRYALLFGLLGLLPALMAIAVPLGAHYLFKAEFVLLNYIELLFFIGQYHRQSGGRNWLKNGMNHAQAGNLFEDLG
jgi:hypothetical protein